MKKRIVSMILALSMMLSILPVSAFADAGAGLSSAAAEETNSITYSSQSDYEDVGTNAETQNQVVKIKIGTNGLPKAASGTGWSFDETTGLTITGTGSEDTEYILDGTVSCNVTVKNANSYTVYLLDGTVTGTLLIEADNMYGVYVLGGSYADVELNLGTIDGGTYDKLTENGGYVRGGFFRDISGLSTDTQREAHKLILPENCTLNGRKETGDIYLIKKYSYSGNGNDLELVVESDIGCGAWAVASTGGSVMALPAGTTDYRFTYGGMTIATVSISTYGKTLSASFSALPLSDNAPMELVQILSVNKELSFTSEGLPDLTGMTYVDSLDTDANLHRVYMGNGWAYNCYPNDSRNQNIVQILDQGGREINFKDLSPAPISCAVQVTNATITDADFGQTGALVLTSGKITGGTYHNANVGINSTNGNGTVEITGGTFDSLYCNSSCSIANAVIQSVDFSTYGNNTYTISDTVLGELPDGIQKLLPAGQRLSTLVVRNGGVTAMNGRTLPLSTNTIYLVGAGSAELTLNTDVLSINDAPVRSYNANTSANGKVLRITGNNDGAEIFVNKSTDPSDLKPLRITEKGLPDLTGVTGVPMSGEGMTANLYEGLGWKYATMEENGRTRAALYITTPDGNPVDLASGAINPYHKAIAVEQITFANVTVTGIVAEGSVGAENTIIQDGTFQKDVYMDENSTIAGGTFQDVVRAYGKITGGAFNAEVQLNQNSEVTGGVFHDVQLPSYATEKTVIQNAMILGSLKTDGDSKAAVSNTVSCGYIESKYLAAGQQQSKLMITDGTVETVNGNAVTADAVYLVGNTAVTLTFSTEVTNINGEDVSAYNGAQLSAGGKTLTLTAKNDGEPIVVNMAATGKLPFSSLSKSDFTVSGTIEHQTVKSSKEGVGELSLVYVRTYDNAVFATYPAANDLYGVYKQRIVAKAGDKYTEGSLDIGEVVRRYQPKLDDFAYDPETQTATYKGPMYFDDAPLYSIRYVPEDGSFPSVTKPTKAGTYSVDIVVDYSDHYYSTQYEVDTYTVAEPTKPKYYYYWNAQEGKAHNEGDKITLSVDKQEGNNVIWKIEGLAEDAYTITDTGTHIELQFFMPSNDVRVTNRYEPIYYTLTVDGKEERRAFGKEVTFTAPEKGGHTFTGWEVDGVPEGTDTSKATITFTMPANNVTLTPQYKKNTYTLTVDGKDEPRVFDEDVTVIAQPVEGKTFTGWKVTGLPTDVDTSKATITFKMPANKVTLKAEYTENAPETYELKVTDAQVTLKDGGAVADLTTVPVGTELVATAPEKEGYTFDRWEKEGLPADANIDGATVTFKMPANKVTLNAKYIANAPETYELKVTDAKVTLKDGSAVADLTAVPAGTELVATAAEKDGYTFTGWEVTGLPADVDTTKATISFTMPANNVTLTPQYKKNTYTLTVDGKDEPRVFDEDVTVIAQPVEGKTFTGWKVTGLPTDVDTSKATITFKMPANKVTLKAEYTENAPKTYKLDVTDAKVTLKDGGAVADLTAVPVGTELVATAPEKAGYTFDSWEKEGLPADANIDGATITFKMPANNVTLKPQYEKNTYTLTVDGKDEQRTFDEEVTVTAPKKDGYTFTGWEKEGLPADAKIDGATITFKMPANNVTLKAQYTENAPEKYTVTMGDETTEYAVGADVTIIAPAKAGETFTGWDAVGVPEGTDTNSETITFKMPKNNVILTPQYKKDSTPTPAPGGDSDGGGAAIVAVAAVGGAAIGAGAYIVGTTAYLKSVLPEGMAIPANRQQLAVALWTAAGKPATQSTALFNDVAADAAELQAIRWVVDTGLMSAQDGSFKPGSRVGRMEVIRTWKTYQQRG
ncbi:InlB B-repeat-containing protein [Faecalibacterium prausnitzii]|uniref:InlB B-repeat-containing protein n=1 Tax=Faecalibacterium prausnitzii TaxID=853 RepID=UPI0029106F8D|nr:InlB B-repeat-containing protein [Faecalibacterium prausnitzii]MDU8724505.1 InlB B-repeat-containing protein [Faecalibacterium prausnitzii]